MSLSHLLPICFPVLFALIISFVFAFQVSAYDKTDLKKAKDSNAYLEKADLSDACLEGVEGLTKASLIEKPSKVVINREKVIKDNFIIGG